VGLVSLCGEEILRRFWRTSIGIRYFGNGVVGMEDCIGEVCVVTLRKKE